VGDIGNPSTGGRLRSHATMILEHFKNKMEQK
jgi:hypothetical protein